MPFADYEDFDDCVKQNQDKAEPEAYCAALYKRVKGKWPAQEKVIGKNNYRERLKRISKALKVN